MRSVLHVSILSSWANDYAKQKNDDAQHFCNAIIQLKATLRSWAVAKQKVSKKFQKFNLYTDSKAVSDALSDMDFQTAAFIICEKLSQFLEGIDKSSKAYVTVYQRIKQPGSDSEGCRMIAYSSNFEPKSYSTIYPIPANNTEGIEFHSYIFPSGQTETIVLPDIDSVKSKFKAHNGCEKREADICQYVGIPIAPAKLGVTFLLQVDVSTPDLMGNSEESVKEFADNTIRSFADFLHMIYEDGRLIEQILNGVKK